MKPVFAVKAFFEKNSKPVELPEMMAFWKACSDAEKQEFAASAAQRLGVQLS